MDREYSPQPSRNISTYLFLYSHKPTKTFVDKEKTRYNQVYYECVKRTYDKIAV